MEVSIDLCGVIVVVVARGVNAGLRGRLLESCSCPLRNVFLAVGDVAESVSNLRLVAFLPTSDVRLAVLSDSFGLPNVALAGVRGVCSDCCRHVVGAGGSIVSDIVPVPRLVVGLWQSGSGGDCGIKASMVSWSQVYVGGG